MQIKIEDISHSGSGVGKIDGKVIFVPHTDIGEIVEIKNIKKGSKFDKAEVANVLTPSKDRCVPSCPYFFICGGCDFQFVNYEKELKLKELINTAINKLITPFQSNLHYLYKHMNSFPFLCLFCLFPKFG